MSILLFRVYWLNIYISTDVKEVMYQGDSTRWGGRSRDFNPSTNFQTRVNFGKIYYKCISFCNFVCFELRFNVSESLKLSIFRCGMLFSVKIPKVLVQLCEQNFFVTSTPLLGKMILQPCIYITSLLI